MRKKVGFALGGTALTFLLSSCWLLQSFTVLDYTVDIGQTTKAQFTLRPWDEAFKQNQFQFVLVGVDDATALSVGKAVWGTNGTFGGPLTMPNSAALPGAIGSDCQSHGLDYASITGITWKGYVTPNAIRDRGLVEKKALVQVNIKATTDASVSVDYVIMGIAGTWVDDGDGLVNAADSFTCWGLATTGVYVKP
jgi:hypothetical protein